MFALFTPSTFMKRLFSLFALLFFFTLSGIAQDIPVEKEDRNTYSFKLPDYLVVHDFEFISAVTTDQPDVYVINIKALTPDKKLDDKIQGKILFEINGQTFPVDFSNGLGSIKTEISGTDKITMRAIDSNVTRVGNIEHPFHWSKIAGLLLAVAVLALVIWQIRKRRKNND